MDLKLLEELKYKCVVEYMLIATLDLLDIATNKNSRDHENKEKKVKKKKKK